MSKLNSDNAFLVFQADPSSPSEEALKAKIPEFWGKNGSILNLQEVIKRESPRMALAAEFKRASPSKGDIAVHLDAGEQAQKYASAGANIISVLTEPRWFKGGLDDMTSVRLKTTNQPYARPAVLRKEFTTSKYQITEAIAAGADTILLIVAVLPQHVLKELIDHARSFGMEPLVEVHSDCEVEVALQAGAKVIGVNNRNLHTFQMDLQTTEHVSEILSTQGCNFHHNNASSKYTICSLSGMSSAFDVDRYRKINVGMCLIGESLMRAADPQVAIANLCLDPKEFASSQNLAGGAYTKGTKIVKICGVTNDEDALVACQASANLIGVIFVPKSKRCVSKEQAKSVVEAVRAFGERINSTVLSISKQESALNQLVANARVLEDASRRPLVVGVFQNQEPEFIREMVQECGLDLVQLHGKEGMKAANETNCGVPAIRVVDIETDPGTGKAASDAAQKLMDSITTDPVAILLDTSIKGSIDGGGTGVTFDWGIAEKIQNAGLPVIIAGGLKPQNISDAVASTRPWGIDVSSGVEATPGKKNHDKVKEFVGGARKAAIEASKGF
jgi:anthranilate synthase/indole-3-glycerol phosphate synthase/phosphoribosylanthranilate isomerase